MKVSLALLFVIGMIFTGATDSIVSANEAEQHAEKSTSNLPPRLKRAESFLGIHYDFHAGPDCNEVGKNTTRAMVENIINQVHPDYIQTDCKGHRGYSSYPTKVGNPAPGFVGDPLRIWRQVTAEHGVALYMHYSGVWDSKAVTMHPDWAVVDADGNRSDKATSFFGPYAEELLIPQLCELAGDYGVDGMWIDGDCWAAEPDYGEAALKAFKDSTGITDVPRKPGDKHWFEFLQFHREKCRQYLRNYINVIKKSYPNFQICSNWAFTDHMPEPVSAPVDFLSGDYSPRNSINSARISARYMARQGIPWDLMAWSFSPGGRRSPGTSLKTAVQLEREAAIVLALGGGFQAYFRQKRDGSIYDERVPVMAEVAKFCRARQTICHHAEPVPQVGLLISTAGNYHKINSLFSRQLEPIKGILQALLESRQCVGVVGEHHLANQKILQYPLIVVPEWEYLEPSFIDQLRGYVNDGGNLLLIGPGPASMFQSELDAAFTGQPNSETHYLSRDGSFAAIEDPLQSVTLGPGAKALGRICDSNSPDAASQPAASVASLGKGKIAAVYFNFGKAYAAERNDAVRQFLNDIVRQLFPEPIVSVEGSNDVDVSLAVKNGKLLVNLVNTSGPHQTQTVIDTIAPVGPLTITIHQSSRPSKITLEPAGKSLPFEFQNGLVRLTLPQLEIHDIIVLEN